MKRVLIITYYWPPSGGSGVQRWLKFSKYLPEYGWQPVIYTPENPESPVVDTSLENDIPKGTEILKRPIAEPYGLYRKLFGIRRSDKSRTRVQPGASHKGKGGMKAFAANFIRANLFIPDPRFLWIRPSVRYLKSYLREHPVDAVISTGPPHSMHLIARKVAAAMSIPWIADFRDPWTCIFYFKHLKMLAAVKARHRALERKVLTQASAVVAVSNRMKTDFMRLAGLEASRIQVITNGYDPDDFKGVEPIIRKKFTIVHTGLLVRNANPVHLWEALGQLAAEDEDFRQNLEIRLIGETDPSLFDSLEKNGLRGQTVHIPYLAHPEAVREQVSASLLLLTLAQEPEAKGILTGKFFEYLASRRPVLAFAPEEGDLAEAIRGCRAGKVFGFEGNAEEIRNLVLEHYQDYRQGRGRETERDAAMVARYERKQLTEQLAALLQSLVR